MEAETRRLRAEQERVERRMSGAGSFWDTYVATPPPVTPQKSATPQQQKLYSITCPNCGVQADGVPLGKGETLLRCGSCQAEFKCVRPGKESETPEALLQQLASSLHAREEYAREIFLRADVSRTGSVSPADLRFALQSLGVALSDEELRALVLKFDTNGDHQLNYEEFLSWLEPRAHSWATTSSLAAAAVGRSAPDGPASLPPRTKAQQKQRLLALMRRKLLATSASGQSVREAFLDADADRSGQITFAEFRTRLAAVGVPIGERPLAELLRPFDRQKTGSLDFNEFATFLAGSQLSGAEEQEELSSAPTQFGLMQQRAAGLAPPSLSEGNAALKAARAAYAASIREAVDESTDDAEIIGRISRKVHEKRWRLLDAFRTFDRAARGDGRINAAEFKQALGSSLGLDVSRERLQALIDAFDVDGDGKLQCFEFVRMLSGAPTDSTPPSAAAAGPSRPRTVSEVHESTARKQRQGVQLRARVEARLGPLPPPPADEPAAADSRGAPSKAQPAAGILHDFQDVLFAEERTMRATFKAMDSGGSKGITPKELKRGLHSLGVEASLADAQRLVRRFDVSGTGQLSLAEFVRMVQSDPERP